MSRLPLKISPKFQTDFPNKHTLNLMNNLRACLSRASASNANIYLQICLLEQLISNKMFERETSHMQLILTILASVTCSECRSLMSISKVRWRFLEKVGVSKVAFSPLISLTRRNSLKRYGSLKMGGQGKLGPKRGTASSEKTERR